MAVDTADVLPARYREPRKIGRGGMGDIYRATDSTLGRAVAVKVLAVRYAAEGEIRRRFTREALAAARLSGTPNIITIFDVGEHHDRPYIVMEYLSGGSLEDVLKREGPQPARKVIGWLEQAARALDAAHAQGVVHRDLKPANLLLDGSGNVHVADFGVASAAGLDSMTVTGTILGTAGYLSPEQAQGERAGPASDRYGLGVVAFELLTGHRPFASTSATAEAAAHVSAPVPSVCERLADLPCELDPVFRRALGKDPAERYPSAAEFVAALRSALDEAAGQTAVVESTAATRRMDRTPAPVAVPPRPPRAGDRLRRLPAWVALVGLVIAVGAAGAIAAVLLGGGGGEGAPQPKVVTKERTVTREGQVTTREVTVTTTPPATTSGQGTSGRSGSGDPHGLNDQGYSLMQQGAYDEALPLLQQAVQGLQGAGPSDPYEGYANYNLGYTLLKVGRCSEAIPYLERAKRLEPDRHEPKDAIKQAKDCA